MIKTCNNESYIPIIFSSTYRWILFAFQVGQFIIWLFLFSCKTRDYKMKQEKKKNKTWKFMIHNDSGIINVRRSLKCTQPFGIFRLRLPAQVYTCWRLHTQDVQSKMHCALKIKVGFVGFKEKIPVLERYQCLPEIIIAAIIGSSYRVTRLRLSLLRWISQLSLI